MEPKQLERIKACVREALRAVQDPELAVNLVDLGMIYAVEISDDGMVHVKMTTTTRGCPAAGFHAGRSGLHRGDRGVTGARVELTYEPEWKPEMAIPEVQAILRPLPSEKTLACDAVRGAARMARGKFVCENQPKLFC
ncbi:metal-sulfur cluster assembly factor [Brucella suis bv. 1]|nr:metal-sulfur cluster assembly factor [Brucella suis bv. 1]